MQYCERMDVIPIGIIAMKEIKGLKTVQHWFIMVILFLLLNSSPVFAISCAFVYTEWSTLLTAALPN